MFNKRLNNSQWAGINLLLDQRKTKEIKAWENEFLAILCSSPDDPLLYDDGRAHGLSTLADLYTYYFAELERISLKFNHMDDTLIANSPSVQAKKYLEALSEELNTYYAKYENTPGDSTGDYKIITDSARQTNQIPDQIKNTATKLRTVMFAARALDQLRESIKTPDRFSPKHYELCHMDFLRKGIESSLTAKSDWKSYLLTSVMALVSMLMPSCLSYYVSSPNMHKKDLNKKQVSLMFESAAQNIEEHKSLAQQVRLS